jgi:TRAP-type C4-dicarboxylate transport system substrate-binding protein
MCKAITERSEGRLVVEHQDLGVHPYAGAEVLSVVRDGLVESGTTQGVYVTGEEPLMGAIDMPFLIPNLVTAERITERWREEILADYLPSAWNQRMISCFHITGEAVFANKLLDSFDALEGQKIRVWSKETSDLVSTVGATPVTVAYKEVYSALEKGVVDGALSGLVSGISQKWFEITKFATIWNFAFPPDFAVVNLDAFNELPPDLQKLVLDTGEEYQGELKDEMAFLTGSTAISGIEEYNVTLGGLSPEFLSEIQARMKGEIWEPWAERCSGDLGQKFLQMAEEELGK